MIEEVKTYTDERIKNTIQQANNFSDEQVAAAKEVALERGIYSKEQIEAFLDAQDLESNQQSKSIEIDEKKLENYLEGIKLEENFPLAVMAGIGAVVISAILWAVITNAFNFQIGFMAIGVGILVGVAIRAFGKGISNKFGILGGGLSLIGILLGNFFSIIGFIANSESLGYLETIQLLDYSKLPEIFGSTFSIIDLLFYFFAISFGYKHSFRQITEEDIIENAAIVE